MKKIFVFVLTVICSVTFAQEKTTSVFAGSKAILFSFSGLDNLNLNTFNGGIGGKFFISNELAIRAGVILNSFSETIPANEDSTQDASDGNNSAFTYGANAAVEWHLTDSRISPFLGTGISYSNSSTEKYAPKIWDKGYTGYVLRTTTETTGKSKLSFFALVGVEIFIIQEISLSAEYHLHYSSDSDGDIKRKLKVVHGNYDNLPELQTVKGSSKSSFGFSTAGMITLAIYL